jgi:hypothetical protein
MATTTQIETQQDERQIVTITTTTEAFTEQGPPQQNSFLRGYRLTESDGKTVLVKEEYANTGVVTYSLDASVSAEPLESNPKYDDERDSDDFKKWVLWKKNSADPALDGWTPEQATAPSVQSLYEYFRQGVTTYQCPRVVVKHNSIDSGAPELNVVGKIADPGGGFNWDGNFLCTGINAQQMTSGNDALFNITVEYLSSAPGRTWDAELYT